MQNKLGFTTKDIFKEITNLIYQEAKQGKKLNSIRNDIARKFGYNNINAYLCAFDENVIEKFKEEFCNISYDSENGRITFVVNGYEYSEHEDIDSLNDRCSTDIVGNDVYLMDINYSTNNGLKCVSGYIDTTELDEFDVIEMLSQFTNNWNSYSEQVFNEILDNCKSFITENIDEVNSYLATKEESSSLNSFILKNGLPSYLATKEEWETDATADHSSSLNSFILKNGLPNEILQSINLDVVNELANSQDAWTTDGMEELAIEDTYKYVSEEVLKEIITLAQNSTHTSCLEIFDQQYYIEQLFKKYITMTN